MGYTDKEKAAAYAREWRRVHAQKVLEDDRKRRQEERERDPHAASERVRKWRLAHPDQVKIHAQIQNDKQNLRRKTDPAYREHEHKRQARHMAKPDVRERRRAEWRERERAANRKDPTRPRTRALKYNYGLTVEQYEAMILAQGGKCAICYTDKPGGRGKNWNVDHCHNSDQVRELLCHGCNTGLGAFKDSPERLRAAAVYLEKHAP